MLTIKHSDGTWHDLQATIEQVAAAPNVLGLMVLACESNGTVPVEFDHFLKKVSIPIFGGVFPALISEGQRLQHGNIVVGFTVPIEVLIVPSLSDPLIDYDYVLRTSLCAKKMVDTHTMFAFVDGLSPRVGDLIESLFNIFGLQGNFIGGGAGSLTTPEMLCLITSEGVIRDAAVIAIPKLHSRVSVGHGWLPLAGPFEVTESDNNVILSLDWEPALEIYQGVIDANSAKPFSRSDFSAIASSYPFGIARLNTEFVVRDPIGIREDGGLICVGDVPQGSLVHIMHGDLESLLAAANKVKQKSEQITPTNGGQRVDIVIDCISRALFMGDEIDKELAAVQNKGFPQIGAFTLGEIANSEQEYLEFHNKTAVVASIWVPNEHT